MRSKRYTGPRGSTRIIYSRPKFTVVSAFFKRHWGLGIACDWGDNKFGYAASLCAAVGPFRIEVWVLGNQVRL